MPEEIGIWSVHTGKKLYELGMGDDYGKKQYPTMAIFSRDGKCVLYNDTGTYARLLDLRSGKPGFSILDTFGAKINSFEKSAFSSNGKYIITKNLRKVIRVWKAATGVLMYSCGEGDVAADIQFSADGNSLMVRKNQSFSVWDIASGKLMHTLSVKGHTNKITSSCLSNDDLLLATGGHDFHIRLWNLQTAQLMKVMSGHTTMIWAMGFNPAKTMLATAVEGKAACIWDIEKGWVDKI